MSVGIDVIGIERFRALLQRRPGFAQRFFSPAELGYCEGARDPALHLAGTFAAKEAVMKAMGLGPAVAWAQRIEVVRDDSGRPRARCGGRDVEVSISHDAGVAAAVAYAPSEPSPKNVSG